MKKTIFAVIILLLIHTTLFAQSKIDSVPPKVVYIFDHSDTVKVETLMYKGADGNVKWSSPGWQIIKGRAYIEDKKRFWAENPKVIGGLDSKGKPVKTL